MLTSQLLVASYCNCTDAETGGTVLASRGLDQQAISFIGKDSVTTDQVSGFYRTNGHIRFWGQQQAIWDQNIPAAAFHLPGIGPLLVTGPLAQSIVIVLENAMHGSGHSALETGLIRLGIPKQCVRQYESAVQADRFLLIFRGTEKEITMARDVLHGIGPTEMNCHIITDMMEPIPNGRDLSVQTTSAPLPKTRIVMSSSRHILFPMDFSERAKGLLPYAGNIARKFGSDITLLYVLGLYEGIHPGGEMDGLDVENVQDEVRAQSEAALLRLSAGALTGVNVTAVVESGDVAQSIARRVSGNDIGLIVMPTHGRGKFRQFLLGSVTSKVLHDNSCSVWTTAHAESLTVEHSPEIHNIVCAVDSTPGSCRVLEAAADLASLYGADVHLTHAIPIQQNANCSDVLSDTVREEIMSLQQTARTSWNVHVKVGTIEGVVRAAALQQRADLIIIGRGRLTERQTHVEAVIREAPCAVLSV